MIVREVPAGPSRSVLRSGQGPAGGSAQGLGTGGPVPEGARHAFRLGEGEGEGEDEGEGECECEGWVLGVRRG